MSNDFEPLAEKILDLIATGNAPPGSRVDECYLLSIAVSMKRIADALAGDAQNTGMHRAILDIGSALQDRRGH